MVPVTFQDLTSRPVIENDWVIASPTFDMIVGEGDAEKVVKGG
jgi:hypothetical protein